MQQQRLTACGSQRPLLAFSRGSLRHSLRHTQRLSSRCHTAFRPATTSPVLGGARSSSSRPSDRSQQNPEETQYVRGPASNFDSLDASELERLHAQLRMAHTWLDIENSLDFSPVVVDEASVVAALVRLSKIYDHYGEHDRAAVRASGLVERLAAMAERRLPALNPAQLARSLDALARLQFDAPPRFLEAADKLTTEHLQEFAPSHLPLLLIAFAALGWEPGTALLTQLGEALAHHQIDATPSEVATMISVLAGLSTRPSKQVLSGLAAELRHQLDSFRPAELAAVLKSLAKLKYYPGKDVMRKVAARAGALGSYSQA